MYFSIKMESKHLYEKELYMFNVMCVNLNDTKQLTNFHSKATKY